MRVQGKCPRYKRNGKLAMRKVEAQDLRHFKNHTKVKFFHEFRNVLNIICNFPITLGFKETFTLQLMKWC